MRIPDEHAPARCPEPPAALGTWAEGLTGIVRETDRDDKRFEVRGIEAGSVTDLRCIYGPKVADPIASKWLNHRVEVSERVERDASGSARLMKVAHLKLVGAPDNAQQQIEFDFPDETT